MSDYRLGIIGAGNMAEAIARGSVTAGVLGKHEILAADISDERRAVFQDQIGIAATAEPAKAARCERLLLSVKPQVMGKVLEQIAPAVRDDALVISIAAGLGSAFFDERLGGKGRIVRVMPNTPMLVGAGVSALCGGPRATEDDLDWTARLLSASGEALVVEEPMMDAVTAVSGSGPAYFFYLVEAMVAAGTAEGLTRETALKLAVGTCRGAGKLLAESADQPETLRARVTSPGGTTQAAIASMDADGVMENLTKAVQRAAQRSRELGG